MFGLTHGVFLRRLAFSASVLLCNLGVCAGAAPAQETPGKSRVEAALAGMNAGRQAGPVAISPDGLLLATVTGGRGWERVTVAPMSDPEKTIRVTASRKDNQSCDESDVAWAPDSKRLAFVGNCQGTSEAIAGEDNVFLATLDGDAAHGKARVMVERLSEAHGQVGYPDFSPDGGKIAFLYTEGATRPAGALAAMKPWAGVIGEDGVEVQRVAAVDVPKAGEKAVARRPEFVTAGGLHVYEFDWRPDSKGLAYVAANPPGENNWWVAKLYAQELGGEPKVVFAPGETTGAMHGLQMAVPRWSPDGRKIGFVGGLMSDQGSTGGDVWLIGADGGEPRNLTEGRKSTAGWFTWADNAHMFVSEFAGGNCQLVKLEIGSDAGGAVSIGEPIFSVPASVADGRVRMSLSSTRDDSVFVFSASSFEHPVEFYAAHATGPAAMSLAQLKKLSHLNEGVEPGWGKAESLSWKSDGFTVQGWVMQPKGYDPAKKYPLIVLVHGGPSAAAMSTWGARNSLSATAFSALGYFVLEPNPRGSYGQGEAFTAANRKDFGYGDLRDILAGLDTVLAKYPVDPERVGLTGWSYGGFMTMFAVTQTNRFKAAVAGAGIANWLSYYGENSIDQWMTPFFGASVYQDPAVYAKSSAINFIDKVKTPVLVVVGDRDGECPAPQSFEFWHALRDEHVPTQLVVYPNEGHGFVNPEHREDVLARAMAWFDKYMPAGN